ncbi:uncharacterized protein LOC135846306 [Planococcus citri]|uniref:uncharacterized protein LOC135846306 n=1 Tax=Planococcus citri TaxID=170843 RepID=UPI0031F92D6E
MSSQAMKNYASQILEMLKKKGFTKIILLFPLVKPKVAASNPVSLDRYFAYRRALESLEDDIVSFWWTPAAVFLDLKRDQQNQAMRQFRVDEHYNMIPVMHKFHLSKKNGRYYPRFARKTELIQEMDKMYNYDWHKKTPPEIITDQDGAETQESREIVTEEDGLQYEIIRKKTLIEKKKAENPKNIEKEVADAVKKIEKLKKFIKPQTLHKLLNRIGIPSPPGEERNLSETAETPVSPAGASETIKINVNHVNGATHIPQNMQSAQPTLESSLNLLRTPVTPKPPLRREEIEARVREQILREKDKFDTCVVPLTVNGTAYPAQLDTGATPNVVSEETANILLRDHYDNVEYIMLKRPIVCNLADDSKVESYRYVIVLKLKFGDCELKIPFYILKGCNQIFIIGTKTMKVLGIKPDVENQQATCCPPGEEKTETLKFMSEQEYREKITLRRIRVKKKNVEQIDRITKKANTADKYQAKEPEDVDDGPEIFLETLRADLEQAVNEETITKKQAKKAFDILREFACIFSKYPGKWVGPPMKLRFKDPKNIKRFHGPKYTPSNKQMPLVREALRVMVAKKIVEPSSSPYINALVVNIKKNGDVRLCLNPMELNPILENDYNEAGLLDRIITTDGRAKIYCCLDFVAGFWQMVLHEACRKYCAFIVDGEVHQFIRVPYGLKVSSALFVKMMNTIMPAKKGRTKYVDDVLLKAATFEEMMELLVDTLKIIRDNGLRLNPRKSKFFKSKINHLGFQLQPGRILKQNKKLEKLDQFKAKHTNKKGEFKLKNEKDVMAFLGIVGFYKRFIADYQQLAVPLYEVIRKENFKWGEEQQNALEKLETEYRKKFELASPIEGQDFYLETSFTHDAMNAVVYQKGEDGTDHVILFVSNTFKDHQKRYTIIEKEMYSLANALKKLEMWLHGYKVHIRKDIMSIVHRFNTLAQIHCKAAAWITHFNCHDLVYDLPKRVGKWWEMQAPELTLYETNWTRMVPLGVVYKDLVKEQLVDCLKRLDLYQNRDENWSKVIRRLQAEELDMTSKQRKAKRQLEKKYVILEEEEGVRVLHRIREDGSKVPCMPDELYKDTIMYLHEEYSHVGAAKIDAIFRRMYYSPNVPKSAKLATSECLDCKHNKNFGQKKKLEYAQIEAYGIADVLSADSIGQIANKASDPKYMLVVKCVFTAKVWLKTLIVATKEEVSKAMKEILEEIKKLGHKVRKVITDNGTQFVSDAWNDLLKSYGVKIGHTTKYNPQSSLVERTMRIIGDRLRVKINQSAEDFDYTHHGWHKYAKQVENEINNTPTEFGVKPNEAWGIRDDLAQDLPVPSIGINAKFELRKLREEQRANNVPSITSEEALKMKMDPKKLIVDKKGFVWVAVDGACSQNGTDEAIAGIGISWTPSGDFNISERVVHPDYKNSNNLAEVIALIKAMEIALKNEVEKLKVFSDSNYLVTAVNHNSKRWIENNWKNSNKKPVHHKAAFQQVIELSKKFKEFELRHVRARKYDHNNFVADKLARKAVYTQEVIDENIDNMTDQQALVNFIREKRMQQRINNKVAFNKLHGPPTIFENGELVMLTSHRLSSYEKGLSKKLFQKRYGPYTVEQHVGSNCYMVKNVADPTDEQIVNTRQMTSYLNKNQLEELKNDLKQRSKFDNRDLVEKIRDYSKQKTIEQTEKLEEESEDEEEVDDPKDPEYLPRGSRKQPEKTLEKIRQTCQSEMPKKEISKHDAAFREIKKRLRRKLPPSEERKLEDCLEQTFPDKKMYRERREAARERYETRSKAKQVPTNLESSNLHTRNAPDDLGNQRNRKRKKTLNFIHLEMLEWNERAYFVQAFKFYDMNKQRQVKSCVADKE